MGSGFERTDFTRVFDNDEIMVLESFSALRTSCLLKYWNNEANLRKLNNQFGYHFIQKRVLVQSAYFKRRLGWDNLLHSISTTLIRMRLCFVSSGIKLNLKVFTLLKFYNMLFSFFMFLTELK